MVNAQVRGEQVALTTHPTRYEGSRKNATAKGRVGFVPAMFPEVLPAGDDSVVLNSLVLEDLDTEMGQPASPTEADSFCTRVSIFLLVRLCQCSALTIESLERNCDTCLTHGTRG